MFLISSFKRNKKAVKTKAEILISCEGAESAAAIGASLPVNQVGAFDLKINGQVINTGMSLVQLKEELEAQGLNITTFVQLL